MSQPIENSQESSYFEKRMQLLGVSAAANRIKVWQYNSESKTNELQEVPIFRESEKGIDIIVCSIDRELINFSKEGSRWKNKLYCLTRLQNPIVSKDGSTIKYLIPKSQGTYPFFPPALLDKYDNKTPIKTLFLVEGYFKAFKGAMHGIDIIGLSSITHMKEKEKGTLHTDILKLMKACSVEQMVWLTDGDCLDITGKELTDGVDLYKRPANFFRSITTFKELLDDYDVEKWFAHINSDELVTPAGSKTDNPITRDQVKGLDDLLIAYPESTQAIVDDIYSVSKSGNYFKKFNITHSTYQVRQYFHLASVNDFYLFHVNRRKDLANIEFTFAGTRYRYNDQAQECEVRIPGESKCYFRVADQYYKFIEKINQHHQIEKSFQPRQKTTITDDHGKKIIQHIPKYEAFVNIPDHVNFHQTLNNCFNVYSPFEHVPEESECSEEDFPTIIKFFKHIFGESTVKITKKNKEVITTSYYQMGLDYAQLLYKNPVQRLPILCLVSKENETGKSTFADLMKAIFTNNVAIVGNSDLADDFNSFWATKLLIICDETKIDKQAVIERVKSLTFAKKIAMNSKGKDKVEIDFFGKFMFLTNNEENFIYANEEDLRYWVIKVPKIREKSPDFLDNMIEEIPAFLAFLNQRKMVTERATRMWFDPALLKTEALKKVIENSKPTVEKELIEKIREMFLDFGVDTIQMSRKDIKDEFFRGAKWEDNYIEKVLKENMRLSPLQKFEYKGRKFESLDSAIAAAIDDKACSNEIEALQHVKTVNITRRYEYFRWEHKVEGGKVSKVQTIVQSVGRPYIFRREQFIPSNVTSEVPDDMNYIASMTGDAQENGSVPAALKNELPF